MDAIKSVLNRLGYDQHEVIELPIPGANKKAFAIEVKSNEALDLWAEFRSILDSTLMWPVLYAGWGGEGDSWKQSMIDEDIFMRRPFEWESQLDKKNVSPSNIIQASQETGNRQFIDEYDLIYSEDLVDAVQYELEKTEQEFGSCPSEEDAFKIAQSTGSIIKLEKWLLDWEVANHNAETAVDQAEYISWFEPKGQREALLLIPTSAPEDVLAYIHWYGAENMGSPSVIAQLKNWKEKYGAELVAHYGTMLHFTVSNPPQNISDAFKLAVEQVALAPCTLALPGVSIREHARCLLNAKRWFIHERP